MRDKIKINDFTHLNYTNILLDITNVDRKMLLTRLKEDYVSHLREMDGNNYVAIWNCDLQGFNNRARLSFEGNKPTYDFAKLIYDNGCWYYHIVEYNVPIPEHNFFPED